MPHDHRFQMRCSTEFLELLDRLKERFGVADRPEVVRIAVKRLADELLKPTPKRKSQP